MKKIMILLLTALTACSSPDAGSRMMLQSRAFIDDHTISSAVDAVKQSQQVPDTSLLVKGVKHAASLWRADDGTKDDFLTFVMRILLMISKSAGPYSLKYAVTLSRLTVILTK